MNKPFNNQDRTRLKHLAGMIEQKRRDAIKNGQGKGITHCSLHPFRMGRRAKEDE